MWILAWAMKLTHLIGSFFLALWALTSVQASEPDAGTTLITAPVSGASICGNESQCQDRIMSFLGILNPGFPVKAEVGARVSFNDAQGNPGVGANAAVTLSDHLATFSNWGGDLNILPFEMTLIPNSENFRIRFIVADSEVAFICSKKDGSGLSGPYASMFAGEGCRPDAMFGMSARLFEFQADTFSTQRLAMRIAEVKGVLNFLRNGFSEEVLRRRLMAHAGASWDVIVPNRLENTQPGVGGHALRLDLGVSGLYISDDSHWEVRGFAGYRPNVTAWNDWAVEARAQVLYRFLLSYDFMAEIGGAAQYSHWSIPGRSLGTYASDRAQDSLFLGAMFGIHYDKSPAR